MSYNGWANREVWDMFFADYTAQLIEEERGY